MKTIITILMSLFFIQLIYAQDDTLLTHYRKKALSYQQSIKMAEKQLIGAESKVEAAKSDMLPHLDFNGKYRYYGVPLHLAPPADGTAPNGQELHNYYALRLDLYQPILAGGYLQGTKKAAMSEVEMMKSLVNLNKQQVVLNSDILYWNAVSKKEIYRLYQTYKEIIGEFLKVIKDRVDEEIVGKNELYQAKVRYNDAEYNAIRAEKEYMVSIMDLNKMIGLPVNSEANVADSLTIINWNKPTDDLKSIAIEQRPEINYVKNLITKNEYEEDIVGSEYNPKFGISAGGKWGSPSPGLQLEPDFNYNFKANLTIPIFYWGIKNEKVFTARQQTEIAKLQMEETKDKVTLEVETSYYRLERSQNQLDFARGSLDNASKNVSVMLDRYNEGLSSVLEVLDAQLYWQKTYLNYIIAKYDLNTAYSQYLYAIGEFTKISQN